MIYRFAASLVLFLHFTIVAFAVFGGLGVLIHPQWALFHIPVVVWSSIVNLAGWTCPLTPLENRLRAAANQAGYQGGFVQHYLGSLVYPKGMPRQLELVAGVAVVLWNGLLYACVYGWLLRGASPA